MIKNQRLESVIHPYALLAQSCVSQAFSTATSKVLLAYPQAPRFRQQVLFSPPFPTWLAQPTGQGHVLLASTGEVEDAHPQQDPTRSSAPMFIFAQNSSGRAPQVKMLSRDLQGTAAWCTPEELHDPFCEPRLPQIRSSVNLTINWEF